MLINYTLRVLIKFLLNRYFRGVSRDTILLEQHVAQTDDSLATYEEMYEFTRNAENREEEITLVYKFLEACRQVCIR